MHYVYVLKGQIHNQYYVGMTQDLDSRLTSHNLGQVKSTKPYLPWRIVHFEGFDTRNEARNREKYLKSAAGRRWRKNNLGD